MKYYYENTKLGFITLVEDDGFLANLLFGKNNLNGEFKKTPLIEEAFRQLEEYLSKKRKNFNLPYSLNKLRGTSFQKEVWSALNTVPYGKTISYGELAQSINHKNAYRALGSANNKNPLPIIIPCHRVIAKNGNLAGYRGGLKIKEKLLKLEQENI